MYNQNIIEKWTKGSILPFIKNYRSITLSAIADRVYNAMFLNHIQSEIEKILRKKSEWFLEKSIHNILILTIYWIIEGVHAKNLKATL